MSMNLKKKKHSCSKRQTCSWEYKSNRYHLPLFHWSCIEQDKTKWAENNTEVLFITLALIVPGDAIWCGSLLPLWSKQCFIYAQRRQTTEPWVSIGRQSYFRLCGSREYVCSCVCLSKKGPIIISTSHRENKNKTQVRKEERRIPL